MLRRHLLRLAGLAALAGPGAGSAHASTHDSGTSAYDPRRVSPAETTLVARVDGRVATITGIPPIARPYLDELRTSVPSVELTDVSSIATATTADGTALRGGVAVIRGSFDTDELSDDLRGLGARSAEWSAADLRLVDDHVAIAIEDSQVVVASGGSTDEAMGHLTSVRPDGVGHPVADSGMGALAPTVSGDVVAMASIGTGTRRALRDLAATHAPDLESILAAVSAIGIGARVGPDRTSVRYGLVPESGRFSLGTIRDLAFSGTDADAGVGTPSVSRRGRVLTVDLVAESDRLWRLHRPLGRSDAP